ncbi:MAG TPA: DUF3090 family protein [Anaerolineaceae bacterium]|jgi:uncharacterized repeat protein (TIGR03847 family)|nr:DUF3090 family protein [Anaerolineaceae bacterium]
MEIDLNPCTRLTIDAIGKPGQRTFFIQGESESETITLLFEKIQLQSLIVALIKFFENLHQKYPDLGAENGIFVEDTMKISPPVDPLFRVGEISLTYENEVDQVCLVVKELVFSQDDVPLQNQAFDQARSINFWCSRDQISQLTNWSVILLQRGRPICPLCSEPIEPDGHLCPKKNGHKKH